MPTANDYYCLRLSTIILDWILVNSDKEYYQKILLGKCRYTIKDWKMINAIKEDLELGDSDKSDNE